MSGLGNALAVLEELSAADLARLANRWSPSAIRRRRDQERAAAYRMLAVGHPATAIGARTLATALVTELTRYQTIAWRFEQGRPPPADPRRALMHRILRLDDGKVLAAHTLRRVLAGVEQK